MKLFYLRGSCALAVHIVINWLKIPCDYHRLERGQTRTDEFLAINPAGKVPTLQLDDGGLLTEVSAILLYLAEKYSDQKLGPDNNVESRYQFNHWLSYLTGDIHPVFYPYFHPQRFLADKNSHPDLQKFAVSEANKMFALLESHISDNEWFLDSRRTILDAYLFVFCRWLKAINESLDHFPNLKRYYQRLGQDEGVLSALEEEGINL